MDDPSKIRQIKREGGSSQSNTSKQNTSSTQNNSNKSPYFSNQQVLVTVLVYHLDYEGYKKFQSKSLEKRESCDLVQEIYSSRHKPSKYIRNYKSSYPLVLGIWNWPPTVFWRCTRRIGEVFQVRIRTMHVNSWRNNVKRVKIDDDRYVDLPLMVKLELLANNPLASKRIWWPFCS